MTRQIANASPATMTAATKPITNSFPRPNGFPAIPTPELSPAALDPETAAAFTPDVKDTPPITSRRSRPRRSRRNRTVRSRLLPQPLQVGPHICCRLIAKVRILIQRLIQNPPELRRQRRIQLQRSRRRMIQNIVKDDCGRRPTKRMLPRCQLIQHHAQRKQIAPRVQLLAPRLLRRHIRNRPHRRPRACQRIRRRRRIRPIARRVRTPPPQSISPAQNPAPSTAPKAKETGSPA